MVGRGGGHGEEGKNQESFPARWQRGTRLQREVPLYEIAKRNPSLRDSKQESVSTRLQRGIPFYEIAGTILFLRDYKQESVPMRLQQDLFFTRLQRGILFFEIAERNLSPRHCRADFFLQITHRNPSLRDDGGIFSSRLQ